MVRPFIALATLVVALAFAAPAQAAVISASGGAGAGGHLLRWSFDYENVDKTLTLTATHTHFDGTPQDGLPQQAIVTLERNNGQLQAFDLLTITASSDGQPGVINKGPQVFTDVNLRVGAGRGQVLSFTTDYLPPLL